MLLTEPTSVGALAAQPAGTVGGMALPAALPACAPAYKLAEVPLAPLSQPSAGAAVAVKLAAGSTALLGAASHPAPPPHDLLVGRMIAGEQDAARTLLHAFATSDASSHRPSPIRSALERIGERPVETFFDTHCRGSREWHDLVLALVGYNVWNLSMVLTDRLTDPFTRAYLIDHAITGNATALERLSTAVRKPETPPAIHLLIDLLEGWRRGDTRRKTLLSTLSKTNEDILVILARLSLEVKTLATAGTAKSEEFPAISDEVAALNAAYGWNH